VLYSDTELRYEMPEPFSGYFLSNPRRMLDAFVRIESARDVANFAQRFGPLELCRHGLPYTHVDEDESFAGLWMIDDQECGGPIQPEPISRWLEWVACARSLLNAAAFFHDGAFPSEEDWNHITRIMSPGTDVKRLVTSRSRENGFEDERLGLGDIVSQWLLMSRIEPRFTWDLDGPRFQLDTGTFGVLGIQLMEAITRSQGLSTCSGCGIPYMREGRRPQRGRRNYCPSCGTKAALRDAQRERRSKLKEQADGTTPS